MNARTLILLCILPAACVTEEREKTKEPAGEKPTYAEVVRQIGRPPTQSTVAPDGSREASWHTEVSEGTRVLTLRFDSKNRMTSSRTETVPRRR